MRITHTLRMTAAMAVTALTLAACGNGNGGDEAAGSGGGLKDDAKFVIGVKFDQPGLGLKEGDKNTGMDVEVAKAIAKGLGYEESEITFKESPSKQREQLLKTGQVDMIVATYSITDERKKEVQFAGPYFVAGQDLLVKSDSDIASKEDLDGKVLCSVAGSTSATKIKEEIAGVQLQEYATYSECVEQLNNGRVEAVTTDDTILAGFASQEKYKGKLKVVGSPFSEENYGVGLSKDSKDCEKVNEIITKMWDDGSMQKIIDANLGPAGYKPNADVNPPKAGGSCG